MHINKLYRLVFVLFFTLLSVAGLRAQELEVLSMTEELNEILTGDLLRKDLNGNYCSLVRVFLPVEGAKFDGDVVGDVSYDVSEYYVYLVEGSKMLQVKCPGCIPMMIKFKDYGIDGVKAKRVYSLRLKAPMSAVANTGPQEPGNITFVCDQDGAELLIGESNTREGVISGKGYSMRWPKGQSVKYTIRKDGYEDYTGTVTVNSNDQKVEVKLLPLFGNVSIVSSPNATIYLDGKKVGTGRYSRDLSKGIYNLRVSQKGYQDAITTFSVSKGDNITVELYPGEIYGSLNVTSSPSAADIIIDGKYYGATPMTIDTLSVGQHIITLRKNAYSEVEKRVNIIDNEMIEVSETLRPLKAVKASGGESGDSHFYVTAGFAAGGVNSPTFGLGYYMPNALGLEIEVGGIYGLSSSETIYWYDKEVNSLGSATYSAYAVYGSLGSAIRCGQKFCITPKVGVKYVGLTSKWDSRTGSDDPAKGANAVDAFAGVKFSYLIGQRIAVSVSPQYDFGIKKSNGFSDVASHSASIKKWGDGFNAIIGLNIYF